MPVDWDALGDDQFTLLELADALYRGRYTGTLTVHFYRGNAELFEGSRFKKLKFSRGGLTSSAKYAENGVDQGPE